MRVRNEQAAEQTQENNQTSYKEHIVSFHYSCCFVRVA